MEKAALELQLDQNMDTVLDATALEREETPSIPLTKILYPLFVSGLIVTLPIWIWVALYQLVLERKLLKSKKLYAENKLNNQIYARKCEVREVKDKKVVKAFLKANHSAGVFLDIFYMNDFENQKIYGLYHNDELVYLSCFKPDKKDNSWFCYALCSLANCNVVGGASKSLKPVKGKVVTPSMKDAQLYEKLGFVQEGKYNLLEMILGVSSDSGSIQRWIREQ